MPHIAPYGSWKSPITTDLMVAKTIALGQIALDGQDIYWLEGRPLEGGRNALMKISPGGQPVECLPAEFNVRTRVHEYGGGAYAVFDGIIYFVNFKDQHLYRQTPGSPVELLTPGEGYRYADFALDRAHNRLICIREDHTRGGEPVNTVVAVALDGNDNGMSRRGSTTVLAEGYNFFSTPRVSPDGTQLCWLSWNHPNMPWDGTELWVATFQPDGTLGERKQVAGGAAESIFQPEWSPAGILHFISDRSGWWNLYKHENGNEALYPKDGEFGFPQWQFAAPTYAFISATEIVCTYSENDGMWRLARLDTVTKTLTPLELPFTDYYYIHAGAGFAVFSAASPTEPLSVYKFDLRLDRLDGQRLDKLDERLSVLQRSFAPTVDPGYFSTPQPIEFPTENNLTAHALFYPPANRDFAAPEGELPPLRVLSHGGPTGSTSEQLMAIEKEGKQVFVMDGPVVLNLRTTPGARTAAIRSAAARVGRTAESIPSQEALQSMATEAAEKHRVDPALVFAVIDAESGWNPFAVSSKGARGLMQLMPDKARELGVEDSFDPQQNLEGGVRHLRSLLERYNGNLDFALAAYNAGGGAVRRAGGVPNYPETRNYVRKITDSYFSPGTRRQPFVLEKARAVYSVLDNSGKRIFTNE